jgi:hypothetical protein
MSISAMLITLDSVRAQGYVLALASSPAGFPYLTCVQRRAAAVLGVRGVDG